MPKIAEWSGDDLSKLSIPNNTNRLLIEFCNSHKSIYVFGAGRIGKGMMNYLEQCEITINGFTTSDTWGEFKQSYKQGEVGLLMGVSDRHLDEVMPLISSVVSERDVFLADSERRERMGRFTVECVKEHFMLSVFLVSHCNLSCKCCAALSPVSRPDFYEFNRCVKDMKQIDKLNLSPKMILFVGGEPLLHPNLFDIFTNARKLFPDATMHVYTNGTLFNSYSDIQLEKLCDFNITQIITEYPTTCKSVEKFRLKADVMGIKYKIIYSDKPKLFHSIKFSFEKKAPMYDFGNCYCNFGNPTFTLFNGNLHYCTRTITIPYFNEHFGTEFEVQPGNDFINIYSTSPEEIYRLKTKRHPFCGYHNCENGSLSEWSISERKIEEWVHVDGEARQRLKTY